MELYTFLQIKIITLYFSKYCENTLTFTVSNEYRFMHTNIPFQKKWHCEQSVCVLEGALYTIDSVVMEKRLIMVVTLIFCISVFYNLSQVRAVIPQNNISAGFIENTTVAFKVTNINSQITKKYKYLQTKIKLKDVI